MFAVARDAAGDFVVAWRSPNDKYALTNTLYARLYDASGQPRGTQFTVAQAGPISNLEAAMDADGDFTLAWADRSTGSLNTAQPTIFARTYHADGSPHSDLIDVAQPVGGGGVGLAMDDRGDFITSWSENRELFGFYSFTISYDKIYARIYAADGTAKTDALWIDQETGHYSDKYPAWTSVAINASGDSVVVWNRGYEHWNFGNPHGSVHGQRLHPDGSSAGGNFQIDRLQLGNELLGPASPSVGIGAAGDFAVDWSIGAELPVQFYDADGHRKGKQFYPPISGVGFGVIDPGPLAMNGAGQLLVTWGLQSDSIVHNAGLYYDANGAPLDTPFALGSEAISGVAAALDASGRAVAVWVAPSGTVKAQLYSAP
jgi:hypothetical protein